MDKPFDKDVLVERLKEQGLPIAEDAVEKVVETLLNWVEESGQVHDNQYVKLLLPQAIGIIRPLAMEQIDKIDGEEG